MNRKGATTIWIIAALLALAGCARAPIATVTPLERDAIAANLMRDITVLASDEFGGRKPGTVGAGRSIAYIAQEFQAAGLTSGTNDPGSAWRAPVELISTTPSTSSVAMRVATGTIALDSSQAFAFTSGRRALVDGAPTIFVGNLAEEVTSEIIAGNVIVMLGEPGVSPGRRELLFKKDPAAIITVVDDEEALAAVRRDFAEEQVLLASEEQAILTVFVTHNAMQAAFGQTQWNDWAEDAARESFTPVELPTTINIEATSQRREFTSYNVIGMIAGQVPGSGAIVLAAHWDHLGECISESDATRAADRLCNGAVDNASGVAALLELARRLKVGEPHDRDIYFLATTAEEAGLLGAKVFAETPPIPLDTIVAAFNFDTVAVAPAGSAVGFVGEGRTPLDPLIFEVLNEGKRQLGDRDFAEQYVQRQDGWALLQKGVPAVLLSTAFGSEITLGPYLSSDYHQPSDEIGNIELGGAIDDLLLHEELVKRVANTTLYAPTTEQ